MHEPTPWITGGCSGRMITTPSGYCGDGFIADVDTKDNAEFIVRACNSHDELLEACRQLHSDVVSLVECIEETEEDGGRAYDTRKTRRLLGEAAAAIAKAKPKEELSSHETGHCGDGFTTNVETKDNADSVISVDRGKDKMPGESRLCCDIGCFRVADLANQYYVRIESQYRPQSAGERKPGPRVDLDLINQRESIFNRVFYSNDIPVYLVE